MTTPPEVTDGFHIGAGWWFVCEPTGVLVTWRPGGGTTEPMAAYNVHGGLFLNPETWQSVVEYITSNQPERTQ